MASGFNALTRRHLLAAAAGSALPLGVAAQGYPDRNLRLVVPYPAGGATDILGRLIGQKLGEAFGQAVIVENKAGASGVLGNDLVAKAPADGYTMLLGITAIVQSAPLYARLPYDPYKDFAPVSQLCTSTSLMVVPSSMPVKTVAEFVALVKRQPGRYSYGTYGNGTSSHIQGELFKAQAGVDLVHVPYKGAAPLMNDLIGGQISMTFIDAGSARSHMQSGAFKVLAVTGTDRNKLAPEAPVLGTLGYRNFDLKGWFGFFLPAATPSAIVRKLSAEVQRIVRLPDVAKRIEDLGLTPVGSTADAFSGVINREGPLYAKLIRDLKIRLD